MNQTKPLKVIVSGGGTGGHIFPAIAIANAIERQHPNTEFLFVGAKGKMEMTKVPEAGYNIEGLWISGLQRKLTVNNLSFPFKVLSSLWNARKILKRFKPDLAVGVGGYASGPMIKVAAWGNVPTVIQEQNSFPGLANKLLANSVDKICVVYEGMEKHFPKEKIIITGSPIRDLIVNASFDKAEGLKHFGLSPDKKVVFVTGGSLGARGINNGIKACLETFRKHNIQLIWQTGSFYIEEMKKVVQADDKDIHPMAFVKRMDLAYAAADLIISRAGGTISELRVVGKPVILMPSPNVTEDHQTYNAMSLVKKNAAILIKDKDAPNTLASTIIDLFNNPQQCQELSTNIKKMQITDAADKIAKEALALVK